jgi:hypothetical protein
MSYRLKPDATANRGAWEGLDGPERAGNSRGRESGGHPTPQARPRLEMRQVQRRTAKPITIREGGRRASTRSLIPAFQEEVNAFSRQACVRARAINSFDPEDACRQASLEAENAAWHALAAQPADAPPPALSIDTLMPGFNVRYGTPDLPELSAGPVK